MIPVVRWRLFSTFNWYTFLILHFPATSESLWLLIEQCVPMLLCLSTVSSLEWHRTQLSDAMMVLVHKSEVSSAGMLYTTNFWTNKNYNGATTNYTIHSYDITQIILKKITSNDESVWRLTALTDQTNYPSASVNDIILRTVLTNRNGKI